MLSALLVLLVLPASLLSSPVQESELADALVHSDTVSSVAVSLLYNVSISGKTVFLHSDFQLELEVCYTLFYFHQVFVQVTAYECERGSDSCPAWRAVNLLEAMELNEVGPSIFRGV